MGEAAQAMLDRDEILKPADIAEAFVMIHRQKKSAWTFEMDVRPWTETW